MYSTDAIQRRCIGVFGATVLCASVALAQFDLPSLTADPSNVDINQAREELKALAAAVRDYPRLSSTEQELWRSKVVDQYDKSVVPLESYLVEGIFSLMEHKLAHDPEAIWRIGEGALGTLRSIIAPEPRLSALAKRTLELPLPQVIDFIPHENLITMCLTILVKSGDKRDWDYVLSTERPEFWALRAAGSRLSDPSPLLKDDPDIVVDTLRSKASSCISHNDPGFAVKWLPSILARRGEKEPYKILVKGRLDMAKKRLAGIEDSPKVQVDFAPSPLLSSLNSREPTAYEILPVLDYQRLAAIKPNFEDMQSRNEISDEIYAKCEDLSDTSTHDYRERIKICRELAEAHGLPFELVRWITMHHVLLAGSLSLKDELEAVANRWLTTYPRDWEHLPETWRESRQGEIDANVYLRGYLAHIYTNVVNDVFSWPSDERLKKLREVMLPVFQIDDPYERDVIYARIYYVDSLDALTNRLLIEQSRDLSTEEAKASYSANRRRTLAELRAEQLDQLTKAQETLGSIKSSPTKLEKQRGRAIAVEPVQRTVFARMERIISQQQVEKSSDKSTQ
ncbi:MAG: hypothetical protein HZB26_03350 [Candidatus Hydrogenedentes bacterium]|nr:hypothetical protein [Candidatus Hydrogenedentota bacterium]